jgi:hypothetical protein
MERFLGARSLKVRTAGTPCVEAHFHCDGEPMEVAVGLLRTISQSGYIFALFKNYARRIRDLEFYARGMVGALLGLNHEKLERSQLPPFKRAKQWWRHRSDKKRIGFLISLLWLILARIETLRGECLQRHNYLGNILERDGYAPVYEADKSDDETAVMSQDLSFIRSAVEQTASRQDARALAWTTALVALSGILGGVVGALLTSLLS